MSMELIKDYVKLNQVVLMSKTRSVFEHDCIVPDVNPDISKILVLDGTTLVENMSVQKDSVTVNFSIFYKILYMSDGSSAAIKAINTKSSHIVTIDAAGADSTATCKIDCDVEHMDYTLLNSRKLSFRSVIRITSQVYNTTEQGITTSIEGLPSIQMKKDTFCLSSCGEIINDIISLNESIDLPAGKISIYELLRSDAKINDVSMGLVGDKINVSGQLNICSLYIADDQKQSLQTIENTVPFTHVLQITVPEEDTNWDLDVNLTNFKLSTEEDSDGEMRIINVDAALAVCARGYVSRSVDVLSDAYCLNSAFSLEKNLVKISRQAGELNTQFVIKEIVSKPEMSPEISQIFNVTANIGQSEMDIQDDKLVLEGFVNCSTLYMSDSISQPIASFVSEIPFKQVFDQKDLSPDLNVSVKLGIEHCSFSILSSSEIELRLAVTVKATMTTISDLPVISKINEEDSEEFNKIKENRPSILIYIVQPGDTLWKIGKKYAVPLSLLLSLNELKSPEILIPGQKLILPGRFA